MLTEWLHKYGATFLIYGVSMTTMYGNNIYLPPSPVVPMYLLISDVTNTNPMEVEVSTPNTYIVGQVVYFSVPFTYGMYQLNGMTGEIIDVDTTNTIFTIAIDASQFDPFTIPSSGEQPATISSAGARNTYNFINLPFHALNGMIGN